MKNFNLTNEEIDRIKNLHESAPKKLDFSRFQFTINESKEKQEQCESYMNECGSMMYEVACLEGANCMESYKKMCESMGAIMEEYGKKCQETALTEGWISEEDIQENPFLATLGRAAATGAATALGSKAVERLTSEESEEESEEETEE